MQRKESSKIPGQEEYERAISLISTGNRKESISLFHKSANLKYPPAYLWLYSLAIDKNEERKWKTKAQSNFNWYQSKAQDGKPDSLVNLGRCFHRGIGTEIDYNKAAELYTKAAEQGFAIAQCNLGVCYEYGQGVPKDNNRAVELYTQAAEQGYATAQCNLGICYQKGEGVAKDINRAAELYTKAAEQGYADAQCNLGFCYEHGEGVPKDLNRAVELYKKTAEQGLANALFNLGVCYQNGEGVPKDTKRAVELYTQAAEQEDADAQYNLGHCYKYGKGVPKDYKKAMELFSKAAKQGLAIAQRLDFSSNDIDVQAIADVLKIDNAIKRININRSNIGNLGAQAIAEVLKINKTLNELDLKDNNIGDSGAQAIAEALKKNQFTVKEIELTNTNIENIEQSLRMKNIGNEGLNAIAEMLKVNNSLQVLDISDHDFGDISKLGDALKYNRSLNELVIKENKSTAKELENALQSNVCLLRILKDYENPFQSDIINELLGRNEEIQTTLSKRIFECKNAHLSLLDYKILERVNVAVIFNNVWNLHQTQQTGKTYEEYLKEYWELVSLNSFSKYFLFILGICKLNQISPFRSHLLGIPKEILNYIGSFLNPNDFLQPLVFLLKN